MATTPWLSPSQLQAWIKLQAVVELLPGVLESQLKVDSDLSHYEYLVLAMLSEAPDRSLRLSELAHRTNATLPRLSHVIKRLTGRGLLVRTSCTSDRRAYHAHLTDEGMRVLVAAAPGHVRQVRESVIDALTDEQVQQLDAITTAILSRIDNENRIESLLGSTGGR